MVFVYVYIKFKIIMFFAGGPSVPETLDCPVSVQNQEERWTRSEMTSHSTFTPHIKAVKWQGSNLGVPGSHRRSGYFYGSRQDSAGVWDVHWRGAIERETNIRMMHKQRSASVPLGEARGGPEAESHDVYLALHPSQVEFANMLSERLQANGYRVYSNMWLFRQNSMRSYKADTSAWEKSTKPWRSAQAQHLSPARPTATGARQEELLLRQCRCFVAILTEDAMESESFVRELTTARKLGMKIIVVHSFNIHRNYQASQLTSNAMLISWEGGYGTGNIAEGFVDRDVAEKVTAKLQMLGIHANAYEGLMSPIGRNVGMGSPPAKKQPLNFADVDDMSGGGEGASGGGGAVPVFPPINSPAKGQSQAAQSPGREGVASTALVHRMSEAELQQWLTGTLGFNPSIAMKFKGFTGSKVCRMKVSEMVSRCRASNVVAKKVARACKEAVDPGMDSFLTTYNKKLRAEGGKMRRAQDMTVDEVLEWAGALQGLGSTRQARAGILETLKFHGINGADLIELDKHDFVEIGLNHCDAISFLKECQTLRYHGIPPAYLSASGSGPFG